jgi:hypothetical protein
MSLFVDWNGLLLAEYFPPSSEGDESWLQASRHDLDSFGLHLGGADGLIEAVRQGAPWMAGRTANCAELAKALARQRRMRLRTENYVDPGSVSAAYVGANAPTYLPILALWVLASSEAEEGFYAYVSRLVDCPFVNTPQLTSAMSEAWEDLELWSTKECAGKFGNFTRRVLGEHRFVGTPRSQCLISRKDDRGIRLLLVACGLRPGQPLTPVLFNRLAELARDAHYLSSSLRTAFRRPQYREPLQHILEKVLQSWDGRRPERQGNQQTVGGGDVARAEEVDATTLALSPSDREEDGWDIRWRFRRSGQGNACQLIFDGMRIPARLEPWGDGFATVAGQLEADALRKMLSKSGSGDVDHVVEYDDAESPELGGGVRNGRIAHRQLRILTWDTPDPRAGEELVERELPLAGPAYLICSPAYSSSLERYLANEGIECTRMPPRGLPDGWTITCIMRSERLGSLQRQWLSDEEEIQVAAARLRFVGGRPILRGGSRLYASYDLPVLEVELRGGAIVECTGVRLDELGMPAGCTPAAARSPVRRFRLTIVDPARTVFEVRVVELGRLLASARLRISAPEGTGAGLVRQFSIDRFGRSRHDDVGLRGWCIGEDEALCSSALESHPIEVGGQPNHSTACHPQFTICGKFLDSLAQLGSVGYGAARDQLSRLAESAGTAVQPALLLLDLRCRAHLEIETDEKGHLTRVHAVTPFLYSLPARHAGDQLFGIGGTLRSQQWLDLLGSAGTRTLLEESVNGTLPALRLACGGGTARSLAKLHGLDMAELPCNNVSRWAGSLDQARSALASWGWGSLSADLGQLQRLQPNSAQFRTANASLMAVDPSTRCQLFRFDDPSVPGLQVYVLGTIDPDGLTRYSFIHDSRWGVWLSESAFARMVRDMLGRTDAYPWPIHYDPIRRELWIPARIKPPTVLERALALCSGNGPRVATLEGRPEGDDLGLYRQDIGTMVGIASQVYGGFVPGVWLCYEWVPPEVANRVAALLGGELRPFGNSHR